MTRRTRTQAPHRATRTRTLRVDAPADEVFPLFCPVREADWLASWDPGPILTESGVAESECVFTTSDENGTATWMVVDHDPFAHRVQLVKITPDFTACLLSIEVARQGDQACDVTVTYSHTALSNEGDAFVEAYTEEAYDAIMAQWSEALGYYVRHGSPLPGT